MAQSTYKFKRQLSTVLALVPAGDPTTGWNASGDNGLYKQWVFSIADLVEGPFQALFKAYKITAVKVDLMFNNTNTGDMSGRQIQVYATPWKTGRARGTIPPMAPPLTEQILLDTQAKTKRIAINGGKKLSYYMRVNQLAEVYNNPLTGGTDYGVTRPKFISTGEPSTKHYGLEMYINKVDGTAFPDAEPQRVRCTATYYMTFRGVE